MRGLTIPILGSIVPNMGMVNIAAGGMARALFDQVQNRVLGLLFGQPEKGFSTAEIIRLARSGTGAVHRVLVGLADSGLVTVVKSGNQKIYTANKRSPIFSELKSIILKTGGLAAPLADALVPFGNKISAAFVYGSISRGHDTARSDIDLMVIAEAVGYPELLSALLPVEQILNRPIHPRLLTPSEWRRKLGSGNSFLRRVQAQPRLFIVGSDDAIS